MGDKCRFYNGPVIVTNASCHLSTFTIESPADRDFIDGHGTVADVVSNFTSNMLDLIVEVLAPEIDESEHAGEICHPALIGLINRINGNSWINA